MKDKVPIGFSTNDLYYWDVSLDEKVRFCSKLGVNAIELGLNSTKDLLDYNIGDEMVKIFEGFDFISIHAPKINKCDFNDCAEKLRVLSEDIEVSGIVVHYDIVDDFEVLDKSGLPFAIENMDSRKSCGASVEEFRKLHDKYENLRFVLDLQHIYEHDDSMELAKDFIKVLGCRILHMHVSGGSEKYTHSPVCTSNNKEKIVDILKLGTRVPIILEGLLSGNYGKLARQELGFVRDLKD